MSALVIIGSFPTKSTRKRRRLPHSFPARSRASSTTAVNPVGLAYVNPNALICARLLTRDVRRRSTRRGSRHRLQRALASARADLRAPVLPRGVRRIGRVARIRGGSLRRYVRRATQHGGRARAQRTVRRGARANDFAARDSAAQRRIHARSRRSGRARSNASARCPTSSRFAKRI